MSRSTHLSIALALLVSAFNVGAETNNIEYLSPSDFVRLSNPGVTSVQLVAPSNSQSKRVTITQVTVEPGASQPRHSHPTSEQIWVAQSGSATLLLEKNNTRLISAGEVVRFGEGAVHGVSNTGSIPFTYISVTSPPLDFTSAYINRK